MFSVGAQEFAKNPGKKTRPVYTLGTRLHSGGPVQEISLCTVSPSSQRPHVGQPYQHLRGPYGAKSIDKNNTLYHTPV